ncbi:unnamed protein product [Peronospora farinosa]|uniref:Uncharacterized protein n=1 Tax=Peronospora farinosa TaxID=134698 RepID=A0ABN8C0E6_9STRA|nr:unnamed protein product [Peronospora farinosa]
MKMEVFAECDEQKDRVKACYGDWFQKLWGGSFDQDTCKQDTQDFRQCVQHAMKRRKEQAKSKLSDDDNSWMDRTKEQAGDFASDAKSQARQTRDRAQNEKEDAKSKMKGKTSEAQNNMQDTASDSKSKYNMKLRYLHTNCSFELIL